MVWRTLGVGIVSTLCMDALSAGAYRLRLTAPLPPRVVGRWFASVARLQPFHADIVREPAMPLELALALPVHYAIGVTLAALYLWASVQLGLSPRTLALALGFGLLTNVLPWLLMFPSMGYGFFGANGPEGTRLFLSSLLSHAFFGLGIWAGVRLLGAP